jgi:hypothetical protein
VSFVVVIDACVLHSASVRDLLVRVARAGIGRMRWTERILDEWQHAIERSRPDLDPKALSRTRALLVDAVEDCLVTGYESLVAALSLPDADDRHVVAAAIATRAQAVVTFNLRDFPEATLAAFGIEAWHPDSFVFDTIQLHPDQIAQIIVEQAADLKHPPLSPGDVIAHLERDGLPHSAMRLRELLRLQPAERVR